MESNIETRTTTPIDLREREREREKERERKKERDKERERKKERKQQIKNKVEFIETYLALCEVKRAN